MKEQNSEYQKTAAIDPVRIVLKMKNYFPLTEEERCIGKGLGVYWNGPHICRDLGKKGSVVLVDIERNEFNEKELERLL